MAATATAAADAAMLEALLTECALKIEVSIPAFPRVSFSQLARCYEVTGLCGLMYDKKSSEGYQHHPLCTDV